MKLGKVTNSGFAGNKRWYDDACGTALAMELVGERWSMLVVRELMFGARRFGELRRGLPGISANVLTERLGGLERAGIVRRYRLPSPANAQVYDLTDWGRESEGALQELSRWAIRSPAHDITLPLSPAAVMMSFRTMYPGGGVGVLGFRLAGEPFVARMGNELTVMREEPDRVDATFAAADARGVAAAVWGKVPLETLAVDGALVVTGDENAARRFVKLFVLPDKRAQ